MRSSPVLLGQSESTLQCTFEDIYVLYAINSASRKDVESVVAHLDRFASSRTKLAVMVITGPESAPPVREDRAMIIDLLRKHGAKVQCLAVVFQATGFRGSIVRSVAFAVFQFNGHPYQAKSFGSAKACAPWISEKLGCAPSDVDRVVKFAFDAAVQKR